MKTSLIRIGNSRGVRLPKAVIEACGLDGEIEMIVESDRLVLKAANAHPRAGWDDPKLWEGVDTTLSEEDEAWLDAGNDDESSVW